MKTEQNQKTVSMRIMSFLGITYEKRFKAYYDVTEQFYLLTEKSRYNDEQIVNLKYDLKTLRHEHEWKISQLYAVESENDSLRRELNNLKRKFEDSQCQL